MNTEGQTVPQTPEDPIEETTAQGLPETQADPRDETIDALTRERDQFKDQLLRAMAEAQNVQRRLRQQMEEDRKYASQALVERLLVVLDSFERSIAAAEKGASVESLLDGIRAVDKQLRAALETVKVERIEAVGQPYNPEVHEAVLAHESDEHPDETVTDEIEAGYTMHGRVIRPAKVRVAKKP